MPHKEWIAEVDGHSIRVTNTWLGGAKLYVDGKYRDINKNFFVLSADRALLSARVEPGNSSSPLIEVFFKAIFSIKAKICVDGGQIGGDTF